MDDFQPANNLNRVDILTNTKLFAVIKNIFNVHKKK